MKLFKWNFEFSKVIVVFLFALFVWIFITDLGLFKQYGSVVSVFTITSLTVIGGLLGTSLGFYYKKSDSYNLAQLKKESTQWELKFKLDNKDVFGIPDKNELNKNLNLVSDIIDKKLDMDIASTINQITK